MNSYQSNQKPVQSDLCKFYSADTKSAFFQMESLNLGPGYLDRLLGIYPFQELTRQPLDATVRRQIRRAHQAHNDDELLNLLSTQRKFS